MMILLPEVGYRAETPRAIRGSLSSAFSSAFRASGFTVLPGRVFRSRWYGKSGSSGSESLPRVSEDLLVVKTSQLLTWMGRYPDPSLQQLL